MFDPARHLRPNTMDFKPPLPNSLMLWVFNRLLPGMFKTILGGLKVQIDETSLHKLRAIQGERCLLLPNHPTEYDPCVVFDIARRLRESFYFVAAREVFDYSYGLRGWFFQHLGVYSLVRGSNDRGSLKTSIDVLSQNKGRLVIFIEGEISSQNESLLPLESGVIQLAMMALNETYKQYGKEFESLPPLYVCPVAIRYVYDQQGLDSKLDHSLRELETEVRVEQAPGISRFERLKRLASCILGDAAAQFGCTLDPDESLAGNVSNLSSFMLSKLEQLINLEDDSSLSYLDRIRRIRIKVDRILGQTDENSLSNYQKHLFEHQKNVLANAYLDLERVVNFVSIYDGYLYPEISHDRCIELIRRLEKEVFGAYRLVHPRVAHVQVLEPIDLRDYFQAFQENKREAISQLTQFIEQQMYQGLRTQEVLQVS